MEETAYERSNVVQVVLQRGHVLLSMGVVYLYFDDVTGDKSSMMNSEV